jgi:hypothetical protein
MTSTRYTAEALGTAEFCKRPRNCMINLHDCACDIPGGPYYPVTDSVTDPGCVDCTQCGQPLDLALIEAGFTTHGEDE